MKEIAEQQRADLEAKGFKVTTEKQKKGENTVTNQPTKPQSQGSILRKRVAEIREKLKARGLDQASTQENIEILKEVAPEYAALQPEARAVLKRLNEELGQGGEGHERWRRNPELLAQGKAAEEVLQACQENPYVADILVKQRREANEELRKRATTNLHKACEGENGEVAVRVEYEDKFTKQPRTRWLRIEVNTKGHAGQGHVVESTVPFLTGKDRDGKEVWFNLGTPPDFTAVRSPELRKALMSLYRFEEKMAERDAKIQEIVAKRTVSVTQAMAKEKGHFAAHHRDWKTPRGGGPLTYGGEATGTSLILREFFAPNGQIDLTGLIGKKQPLKKLDPMFGKLINYRLNYETQQREREAAEAADQTAGQNEPAEKPKAK